LVKRTFVLFFLIFGFLGLQSCSKEKHRIPEDQFSDIYIELLRAQDSLGTAKIMMEPALDSILKKQGVSRPLYDSTVQYYMSHPEDFRDFMKEIQERIPTLRDTSR